MVQEVEPGGSAAPETTIGPVPTKSSQRMSRAQLLNQTVRNGVHKVYKRHPLTDDRRGRSYIDNSIRTARYTVIDFFPKQLIFQFSRIGNFYFLCVGVPQTIPGLSTTGNYTTILPLMFFVLLTIAKEGYDDWKRHRLDNVENAEAAMVLKSSSTRPHVVVKKVKQSRIPFHYKGISEPLRELDEEHDGLKWVSTKWCDIQVGDVIKLARDEPVPADIVLLHSDGEDDIAYIETMALDGETNLKSKQVSAAIKDCGTIQGLRSCAAHLVIEDPNPDLYRFDGKVTVGHKTLPLTLNEVIYRGSVVRNTPSLAGLVVNTGEECKIPGLMRMNANQHPKAKRPALEIIANKIVITLAIYVIVLSIGCSMGYVAWQKSVEAQSWYLDHAKVPFYQIFIAYIIQFNNVIPLALYVSLEIVKIGQLIMLNSDIDMYDAVTDTPPTQYCRHGLASRSRSRSGPLAQANDSDSDDHTLKEKTSFSKLNLPTIARRPAVATVEMPESSEALQTIPSTTASPRVSMTQRRSSSQWRSTARPDHAQPDVTTSDLMEYIRHRPNSLFARKARQYILAMALCHTCLPEIRDGVLEYQASSPDELALVRAAQELGYTVVKRSPQHITLRLTTDDAGSSELQTFEILDVIEFSSKRKRMSIVVRYPDGRVAVICKGADSVILPRLRMANMAKQSLQESRPSLGGRPSLTARRGGPPVRDANALLRQASTARSRSFEVGSRPRDEKPRPSLNARGLSFDVSKYTHLQPPGMEEPNELDRFSFLEDPLIHDDPTIFSRCFKHLDDFAAEGLRTLIYAQRFERVEAAAELIEQSFDLVGASAIEDKLQEGVPDTIDRLRRANIRIWMLTGDKRETAINIAHSARIVQPGSDMYVLDSTKGSLDSQMLTVMEDIQAESVHSVVVVDGHTLSVIENSEELCAQFYAVVPLVDSVICCRASPAQKALLVKTASHVGIGISGKEGLQAARVADYSIAQFRFLQRMLFVHGRWNYVRTAKFILATFWKEMFFYLPTALYQRYNGYTGTSLYEFSSLTVFNTLFTSLCVICMGIWEQDLRAETLLAVPELIMETHYKTGIVMFCFFLTTIGWWAWQGFLSGSYARTPSIYAVRDGFAKTFGPDPAWWATLFAVLGVLGLLDFSRKLVKRTLIGLDLWSLRSLRRTIKGETQSLKEHRCSKEK
ncbi:unnamed protein product [Parascedosporium putredinis]|uniref:Phospholipid-transporting ATPase n=1 Tax=Parascedosporium putredinis TaxID=1442378 RepID=A0A9P1MCX4_9PEZI|nr:unnamed protein product [Parascedosporium putredinis]CAI7999324.1 unnamed protein product [Parascedosporium putredinis]